MDPRSWGEVQAVFHELIALEPADRSSRLAAIGATDPALREVVESLLAADADVETRLATLEATFRSGTAPAHDPLGLAGHTVSHFHVLEPLGAGGMGVVYRAEDTRLNRAVALKFLLPQYSLDAAAKARFLQEAHSAAALDHPNVCNIHEVGESDDGRLFLAMALYSGETLKARLAREGPLPVEDALAIARQIAEGLACAHAGGIVHRDCKPGNVMLLPDGQVKILDFGLAKARDQSLSGSSARLGTVAYMAPEQVRGEAADVRTDLWALGVVLYEMLTGRKPFAGEQDAAIAHAILDEDPVPPSALRPDVPWAIEKQVLILLEKVAPKRYATTEAFLVGLAAVDPTLRVGSDRRRPRAGLRFGRRLRLGIAAVGIIGVVTAAAVLAIRRSRGEAEALSRVVVMPFENRTGIASLDPVSVIAADWVAHGLTEPGFLTVLDTRSALAAAHTLGAVTSPTAVGRETGAGVVVAGSYFLHGDSLEFQAWVASTSDGSILLSIAGIAATRDRPLGGVEQLRHRVLGALASLHDRDVAAFENRLSRPPTYDAYREYTEGLQSYMRLDYREAIRHFARAAALDSTFLTARLWEAQASWPGVTDRTRGDSILTELGRLRDRLSPFDRARLDWLVAVRATHLEEAYLAGLRMVEAEPGSADARREAALNALRVLRPREALRRLKELDPEQRLMREWRLYWYAVAWAHHLLSEYDEELVAARRARHLFPQFPMPRFIELRALAALDRVSELDSIAHAAFRAGPEWDFGVKWEFTAATGYDIAAELLAHGHREAARRLAHYAQELVATRAPPDSFGARGKDEWLAQRARFALLLGDSETAAACTDRFRYPEEHRLELAQVLAAQGRRDTALATLQEWKRQAMQDEPWDRNLAISVASVLARVGDLRGALHVLAATPATDPIFIGTDGRDGHSEPALAPLWSNPRFRALIKPKG